MCILFFKIIVSKYSCTCHPSNPSVVHDHSARRVHRREKRSFLVTAPPFQPHPHRHHHHHHDDQTHNTVHTDLNKCTITWQLIHTITYRSNRATLVTTEVGIVIVVIREVKVHEVCDHAIVDKLVVFIHMARVNGSGLRVRQVARRR